MKKILAIFCAILLIQTSFGFKLPQTEEAFEPSPRLLGFLWTTISAVTSGVLNGLLSLASDVTTLLTPTVNGLAGLSSSELYLISNTFSDAVDTFNEVVQVPSAAASGIHDGLMQANPNTGKSIINTHLDNLLNAVEQAINVTALTNPLYAKDLRTELENMNDLVTSIKANVSAAAHAGSTGLYYLLPKALKDTIGDDTVEHMKGFISTSGYTIYNLADDLIVEANLNSHFNTVVYLLRDTGDVIDYFRGKVRVQMIVELVHQIIKNQMTVIEEVPIEVTTHLNNLPTGLLGHIEGIWKIAYAELNKHSQEIEKTLHDTADLVFGYFDNRPELLPLVIDNLVMIYQYLVKASSGCRGKAVEDLNEIALDLSKFTIPNQGGIFTVLKSVADQAGIIANRVAVVITEFAQCFPVDTELRDIIMDEIRAAFS